MSYSKRQQLNSTQQLTVQGTNLQNIVKQS